MNLVELPENIEHINELWRSSAAFGREMVAEFSIKQHKIILEKIGIGHPTTPDSVDGWKFKRNSIVIHTHLHNTRPSDRDMLTMIYTCAIENVSFHVVISPDMIYMFHPSPRLLSRLQSLIIDTQSESSDQDSIDSIKDSILSDLEIIQNDLLEIQHNTDTETKKHLDLIMKKIKDRKEIYTYTNLKGWTELMSILIKKSNQPSTIKLWIHSLKTIGIIMNIFDRQTHQFIYI